MTDKSVVAFNRGAGLMSREDLKANLSNASMAMPAVGGDKPFLRMDKGDGTWIFGQDEIEVEPDSLWAANPASFLHGWVAWDTETGGAPIEEIMVSTARPLPPINSLPDLPLSKKGGRLEYQQQRAVDLVCILGESEGTTVTYKQSSVGAMKAFKALVDAILIRMDKGSDAIVPIVKLSSDDYKHKKYGRIFNPVFEVVEWRTMDDTSAPVVAAETKAEVKGASKANLPDDDEDEAALAAEYAATQAAAAENPAPRRRMRR